MGLFTEHDGFVQKHDVAECMRRRLRDVKYNQKTQRKGSKAYTQWQQAVNEVHATFYHLQQNGIIDMCESLT
jgi:hypothetical protein